MSKFILAAIFLLPLFLFANGVVLYYNGIENFSIPTSGIYVMFDTDLGRLKALADVWLDFKLWKGNLQVYLDEEDAIKYINLDIDEVKLEYGYLKHPDIRSGVFDKEDWILRMYNNYIFFGSNSGIFSSIGPLLFDIRGSGQWKIGVYLGGNNIGMSLFHGSLRNICFQAKLDNIAFGIYEAPFLIIEGDNFYMGYEMKNGKLVGFSFFKSEDGYIKIGGSSTEFAKKVGKGYVIGKISKKSEKIALGFELNFQF